MQTKHPFAKLVRDIEKHFPAKPAPVGEVLSLIKNVRIVMERQKSHPRKIAKQTMLLLVHFGIPVIEDFVEIEEE